MTAVCPDRGFAKINTANFVRYAFSLPQKRHTETRVIALLTFFQTPDNRVYLPRGIAKTFQERTGDAIRNIQLTLKSCQDKGLIKRFGTDSLTVNPDFLSKAAASIQNGSPLKTTDEIEKLMLELDEIREESWRILGKNKKWFDKKENGMTKAFNAMLQTNERLSDSNKSLTQMASVMAALIQNIIDKGLNKETAAALDSIKPLLTLVKRD